MQQSTITVSAPGKIHLMGEHAVVYGKPALIAAIDKRCFVSIEPREDRQIQIISKNYNLDLSININKIAEKTENARKSWQTFIDTKDISFLASITKEPLDYPFLVIGETLKFYDFPLENGFSLIIDSQIPIGSGCGSSSAIAVAIVSAITLLLEKPIDKEIIFKIAVKAEEFKHGTPSGGDPATVLHGGLVWFQKVSATEKIIKPLDLVINKEIASNFYLADTGKPEESTGEMIAIVRQFREENFGETKQIFDELEGLTNMFLKTLKKKDSSLIMSIIKSTEGNLEKLGVVSEDVKKIIREIEKSGGAAKISGGGGKTKGTGMLLVYHKGRKKLENVVKSYNLNVQPAMLGAEGITYGTFSRA